MNCKSVTFFFALLVLSGCALNKNSFEIGNWKTVSDVDCFDIFSFKGDTVLKVKSGKQQLTESYLISQVERSDFDYINMKVIDNNGEPDCMGRYGSEIGSEMNFYLKLNKEKTEMYFYFIPQESGLVEGIYLKKI